MIMAADEFAGHMTLEEFHERIQFNSGIKTILSVIVYPYPYL